MPIFLAQEFVDRLVSDAAHQEPCDEGNTSDLQLQLPPWYDEQLFNAGQKFFRHNLFAQMTALLHGLICLISIPTTLDIMVHTRNSSSPCTAYRRYIATFLHALIWQRSELKPGSESWTSLHFVRARHLRVAKNAKICGVGTISQRDLAFTQLGLVGLTFVKPHLFSIQSCDKLSWEGCNHVWRTLCYMIGVKNKYNICIGTVEETREICRLLIQRVFTPLLESPPEPFEHMAYVILDGFWSALPIVEPKGAMYFTRYAVDVPGYVYTEQDLISFRDRIRNGELKQDPNPVLEGWPKPLQRPNFDPEDFKLLSTVPEFQKLTFIEKSSYHMMAFLINLYATTLGRVCLNGFIKFVLFLSEFFPIFAFARFGVAKSYVNIYAEPKPDNTRPMSNAEVLEMYNRPPWYMKWNFLFSKNHHS